MLDYEFYWEPAADGGVRLLRVFGGMPEVVLPAEIEGSTVTEIGPYCFAERPHLPAHYRKTGEKRKKMDKMHLSSLKLREICGGYPERIVLPDTVKKIGNLAFYNCTSLVTLELGSAMMDVGGDAFMNCRKLHTIILHCGAREKSGIRQMLSQISSDIEVIFQGEQGREAVLLFPEYYEGFDEITPAHIFGRKIEGEGFRARQSFKNGVPDFAQYDQIFQKACVEETVETLCRLAMNRLRYPVDLGKTACLRYEEYIRAHADEVCGKVIKKRKIDQIEFLCEKGLMNRESLSAGARGAAEAGWAEGAAYFLRLKEKYFSQKENSDRYSFKDL